jgi:hypothetical protein
LTDCTELAGRRRLSHSTPQQPLPQATDFLGLHRIGNTQNLWRLTPQITGRKKRAAVFAVRVNLPC